MPRFAVLEHDHPARHWDLLLEHEGVLLSWRLSAPPANGGDVDAEQSFDHRLLYLDYEGPVAGGRGRVTRWDGGVFEWVERTPDRAAVRLAGGRLRGLLGLERRAGAAWIGRLTADEEGG
jgi:hypothetical protein